MRVEIWCERGCDPRCLRDPSKAVESLKVWEGELPLIPRVDDLLEVFDGFAAEHAKRVWWLLGEDLVRIDIGPDYTGEYAERLQRFREDQAEP